MVFPEKLRSWIYQWRHPEYRLQLKLSTICRNGIEKFLDSLAREKILTGKFLEIGAGERTQNKMRFGASATLYCRSDLVPPRTSTVDVLCDCTHLGFSDGSLDVVICSEVLEHVADIQDAVAEFARVLRDGGHLVITMPFFYPLHGLDSRGNGDYWRLTPASLRRLFNEQFTVVRENASHFIGPQDPFLVNYQLLLKKRGDPIVHGEKHLGTYCISLETPNSETRPGSDEIQPQQPAHGLDGALLRREHSGAENSPEALPLPGHAPYLIPHHKPFLRIV
jgi:SAM-dependent methyltransferase